MTDLLELFSGCRYADYIHTENDGDFAIERKGKNICFFFQKSNSKIDWKNNFDFPTKPYKDMGIKWYCHRGFLRVWKSIEPYIAEIIEDHSIENVYIVGYSHGGPLATLCHEYVWFHRPDIRENIHSFAFGSPRCYWGPMKPELKERWKNLQIIRNGRDIVTHLPPALFGFRHVNKVTNLARQRQMKFTFLKSVNDHYPFNYSQSIEYREVQNE